VVRGMTSQSHEPATIVRTERGLSIEGKRTTLYDVMDYVKGQYPPKFIRAMLNLTDEQVTAALSYIETHHEEVEAEYQLVLKEAEDLKQYYEMQNRELTERIAKMPPPLGREVLWGKLQTQKAKLKAKLQSQQ
jgi:uncharacterized protein (DUF433 family)